MKAKFLIEWQNDYYNPLRTDEVESALNTFYNRKPFKVTRIDDDPKLEEQSQEYMKKCVESKEFCKCTKPHIIAKVDGKLECVVLKPKVDLFARNGNRIVTKLKHKDFK